jgi:hypothetical protein
VSAHHPSIRIPAAYSVKRVLEFARTRAHTVSPLNLKTAKMQR